MSIIVYSLSIDDLDLDNIIRLFHKALNTRSLRTIINNFDIVSSHELQANFFELCIIIRLKDLKDIEYCYSIMNVISNRESLLVFYNKEYIKLIEVIFHVTDSFVFVVRGKRHVDEIDLHSLKETCNNNKFERVFELIKSFAMINLTQFDEEIDLMNKDIIVFVVDLDDNGILIGMT